MMSARFIVTIVSFDPSASADSAACDRSSGPALFRPIVNEGTAVAPLARAEAQHDGRVEAAADVADHRHVAPQPTLDRLAHQVLKLVDQRRRVGHPALLARVGEVEVPVLLQLDPAVAGGQEVPRRQDLDPLEERPRRAGAERVEEDVDPLAVGPGVDHPRGEDRLDLRAPDQPAVDLGVVQRADAHPVAAQDQGPLLAVPERHGVLAARLLEHPLPQVLVQVDPEFGVAARGERMPARQQLC